MRQPFFSIAYYTFGEPEILYTEGAVLGMESAMESWGADDDYWPIPVLSPRLMTFIGVVWDKDSHEGCPIDPYDSDDGEQCHKEGCSLEHWDAEFAWRLKGEWRQSTAADLLRAGLIADSGEVGK